MKTADVMFGPTAIQELRDRTEYEAWLLEAIYRIVDQTVAFEGVDQVVYPPRGDPPRQTHHIVMSLVVGRWQTGFLQAGAPLVLVTAFKLADMLLEWVLEANDSAPTHRFEQKIGALNGEVRFPALVADRPWLRERLVALYERLEPLRGTIIHERHFASSDGVLKVSSSKRGVIGPQVEFNPEDLRNLAVLFVSVLRYIEGSWEIDEFREKQLRRTLDELAPIHLCTSLGQGIPSLLTVRVYVPEEDQVRIDLERIRRDVNTNRADQDAMFNLRVVSVDRKGTRAEAYLIPWQRLRDAGDYLEKQTVDLLPLVVATPADLDLPSLARDLNARGPIAP